MNTQTNEQIIAKAKEIINSQYATGKKITCAEDSKDYFILNISNREKEAFYVMFLDNSNRILAFEKITDGTINNATIYPREIARLAFKYDARSIILAHNHTSLGYEPSPEDKRCTKELKKILEPLEIRILDHVIVAGAEAISFSKLGLI